jgi:DNA-binding PadR family transcriptional regulator
MLTRGEATGAELLERIAVQTAGRLAFSEATVYNALSRMVEHGLISLTREVARSGRNARYYVLTRRGHAAAIECRAIAIDLFAEETR